MDGLPSLRQQLRVSPIDDIGEELGDSRAAYNLLKYIKQIGAATVVIEDNYIDVDYLTDFSNYHSYLFENVPKCTKRFHLFSGIFKNDKLEYLLNTYSNNQDKIKDFLGNYLGFFILKPFKQINGYSSPIGRSLLCIPEKSDSCRYAIDNYQATFYGHPFKIETLPFQTKDHAVGLCATVSLWVLTKKMSKIFKTPLMSPYEITKIATEYVEPSRNTPYDGLTSRQMLTFFKAIKVDYNIIDIQSTLAGSLAPETFVTDVIKAFIYSAKLPLVAHLGLMRKNEQEDFHSVVICGYKQNKKGKICKLFIHDDAIGPFTQVIDASSNGFAFSEWHYDWRWKYKEDEEEPYDEIRLIRLLVPFNPSIRLSFNEIYFNKYLSFKQEERNAELYLTTVAKYKKKILNSDCKDKLRVLEKAMPRFLWIISLAIDNKPNDVVYDATSHYIRRINEIRY